jgi:hypothetical protein
MAAPDQADRGKPWDGSNGRIGAARTIMPKLAIYCETAAAFVLAVFNWVETEPKVSLIELPSVPMAVMAATAMRAAIRPYSIAVAPSVSLISLRKRSCPCLLSCLTPRPVFAETS